MIRDFLDYSIELFMAPLAFWGLLISQLLVEVGMAPIEEPDPAAASRKSAGLGDYMYICRSNPWLDFTLCHTVTCFDSRVLQ